MASTTRDFNILLTVRADLRDALGKISSLDSSLHGIKSTVLDVAGALGIGFSIAGIVDFVKQTIEADNQLGNMSKTLGISTEQLSALRAEAKKSGLALEDVQTGLVQLSKGATGQNAEGSKALKAIGVDAKDAAGNIKPLDQLLQLVASKFAGYNDGTAKAALATALFGRSGAQLIPLLDRVGNEGLDNLTQKAIAAGTAVDHNAVQAAEKFQNALDELKNKLQGAVNEGLAQFTPEIDDLASKIDDPAFKQGLVDVAEGIAGIGKAAVEAVAAVGNFGQWLGETLAAATVGPYDAQRIDDRIGDINDQIKKLQEMEQRPVTSRVSEFLQDLSRGPNVPAAGLPEDEVTKSTAAVNKEIAALEAEKKVLEARAKLFKAPPESLNTASANAAADSFIDSIIGGKGKTNPPILGGDKTTDSARAAAAALQALQNQLASLRTQGLDPTQTAWAEYNKTVDQAIEEAKKAGNTPAANAALNAVVEQAARIRDAKLDEIAKQDKKAWDDLLHSLATPAEAHVQDAIDEINQLNELLQKVPHSAEEYQKALQGIINKALPEKPDIAGELQGLLPQGADLDQGPLAQVFQAQQEENDYFKQSQQEL